MPVATKLSIYICVFHRCADRRSSRGSYRHDDDDDDDTAVYCYRYRCRWRYSAYIFEKFRPVSYTRNCILRSPRGICTGFITHAQFLEWQLFSGHVRNCTQIGRVRSMQKENTAVPLDRRFKTDELNIFFQTHE